MNVELLVTEGCNNMLESLFLYHLLAFQELEIVPPQELETVPRLGGPFPHHKN